MQNNKNMKIPSMGFTDLYVSAGSSGDGGSTKSKGSFEPPTEVDFEQHKASDQEILESTEEIYFTENTSTAVYELERLQSGDQMMADSYVVQERMLKLKKQHKVISKKVNFGKTKAIFEQKKLIFYIYIRFFNSS